MSLLEAVKDILGKVPSVAPSGDKYDEIRFKARIDAIAADVKWERDHQLAQEAGRNDLDKAFFQSMLDATRTSIDRAQTRAQLVQQAAAAIGTLYAGILAVSFSVTGRPLPIRGLAPAFFLGLAIFTSTVYMSFFTAAQSAAVSIPEDGPIFDRLVLRLKDFLKAIGEVVDRRVSWLRASVVALAVAVVYLPAAYVTFGAPPAVDLTPYPWPSPPTASDIQTATVVSVVYTAQVAEVTAERQRAQAAASANADLIPWALLSAVGLLAVFLIPRSFRKDEATAT